MKTVAKGPTASTSANIPDDVRVSMIATIFSGLKSLVLSVVVALAVSSKVWVDSRNSIVFLLIVYLLITGIARIVTHQRFQKIDRASLDINKMVRWERQFAIWSLTYTAGIGALVFITFTYIEYLPDHILVDAIACGVSSGIASRNAGSPRVAIAQLALLLIPIGVASLLRLEGSYIVLAVLNFFFLLATVEIVRNLHARALDMLLMTREKSTLATSLASKHELLEAALSNMSHGLCLLDADRLVVMTNARFRELLRIPDAAAAKGTSFQEIVASRLADGESGMASATVAKGREQSSAKLSITSTITLRDGRCLALSRQPMADGCQVVLFEDVTERLESESRIAHMATHDPLTDLPNRTSLNDRLRHDFDHLGDGASLALLCLDLDRFKAVNDTLGHAAGDAVICEVARRVCAVLDTDMMVARVGGDEFVIVANNTDETALRDLAETIIDVVSAPYHLDVGQADIGVSIGVALTRDPATSPDDLLRNADIALYDAKDDGRGGVRLFLPSMMDQAESRRRLEVDMRLALQRGEFVLAYQPQFDLASNRIVGVEALIRWQHPKRGLLGPGDFISAAEASDLIVPIGEWVLRQACQDAASWPRPVRIAVNVSPAQFAAGDLLATSKSALSASGIRPDQLDLEITESLVLDADRRTLETLKALRDMGIRLTIDDFGKGYSSLNCLRTFVFDCIKIEGSFIQALDDDPLCRSIVRFIVGLAREMGIPTIAECVETQAQLDFVREVGCTEAQGFWPSRPISVQEIAALLASEASRVGLAA